MDWRIILRLQDCRRLKILQLYRAEKNVNRIMRQIFWNTEKDSSSNYLSSKSLSHVCCDGSSFRPQEGSRMLYHSSPWGFVKHFIGGNLICCRSANIQMNNRSGEILLTNYFHYGWNSFMRLDTKRFKSMTRKLWWASTLSQGHWPSCRLSLRITNCCRSWGSTLSL